MIKSIQTLFIACSFSFIALTAFSQSNPNLNAFLSYPEPSGLTSSGSKLAWAFNEQGKRNIYVAQAPEFKARKLTSYNVDDGQEITALSISNDGKWVVYIRGGENGSNWSGGATVNTTSSYVQPKVQIWSLAYDGGEPILLGEGGNPKISPNSKEVAFGRDGQLWTIAIDGSGKANKLFTDKGRVGSFQWSPSGEEIVFSSSRSSHSFIGIYAKNKTHIEWISPSFSNDTNPIWSEDGKSIAFIRLPGETSMRDSILKRKHSPWEIRVADVAAGSSKRIWKAPETLAGSVPTTHGRFNLNWAANNRVVFLSYHDGWPHIYSIPASGGKELLLTPGNFMAENIMLSQDGKSLIFSANTGSDPKNDIDRRHIAKVSVDKADMKMITSGQGIESSPVYLNDGIDIAFLSSTTSRPAIPAWWSQQKKTISLIGEEFIPKELPQNKMVAPKQVVFKAADGTVVHGQLFEKEGGAAKKPAIVFVHGGPQRQMYIGWDHSTYYCHTYAMNQYFANLGYVVLSVNYRLGIGYGYEFHMPEGTSTKGAAEYLDVKAAGEWLANYNKVDPKKIGIYGGSYGGYLVAFALAKDSELFAAGVDIHGVHNRVSKQRYFANFEAAPDAELAEQVVWQSSPVAYMDTWKSPVLVIHADDDRNVAVSQSVDLIRRLEDKGIEYEYLMIPDDTHHWMRRSNLIKISEATIDFFERKLKK